MNDFVNENMNLCPNVIRHDWTRTGTDRGNVTVILKFCVVSCGSKMFVTVELI